VKECSGPVVQVWLSDASVSCPPVCPQAHIKFPIDYPYSPPTFRFLTKMWHPNIYEVKRRVPSATSCSWRVFSVFPRLNVTRCALLPPERRRVHLHPPPAGRRPSERRAALREVEPHPERQVSAHTHTHTPTHTPTHTHAHTHTHTHTHTVLAC